MPKLCEGISGLLFKEPLLFELSSPGREGFSLIEEDLPQKIPLNGLELQLIRTENPLLPEVSEPDVVRHFTRLSQWNFSIDTGFYPLGSCTMKYNPRVNEEVARISGF